VSERGAKTGYMVSTGTPMARTWSPTVRWGRTKRNTATVLLGTLIVAFTLLVPSLPLPGAGGTPAARPGPHPGSVAAGVRPDRMPSPATSNPFSEIANGPGTGFTVAVTAGDTLMVGYGGTYGNLVSDSQVNSWNAEVTYASAGQYVENTTVRSTGTDTITIEYVPFAQYEPGWAIEVGPASAGKLLASGTNYATLINPGALTVASIALLYGWNAGGTIPSSGGTAWNVTSSGSSVYGHPTLWAQNVSANNNPGLEMNNTLSYGGQQYDLWLEIPSQGHVPPAPTGLVISGIGYHRATATWTNPSGTVLNDTAYLCNTTATCPATLWANSTSGPATTFTWIGLAIDHTYGVAISAWNSTGQSAKVWTNFTTLSYPTPAAPTALTVEPYSSNPTTDLELTWTNPSTGGLVDDNTSAWIGATSCAGMPSTESQGPATNVSELSIWYGLTPQTPYSFEVAVNNSTGWSQHTACVTNWTTPLAPTGLMNTTLSFTSIDLSWTNPGSGVGLVNDTVYWEVGSSCSGTNSANSTTGAASSYFLMDLPAGTTLAISVTAWDQGGQSAQSNCLVLMTYSYPPPTASSMDIFPLICLAIIAAIIVYAVNKRKKQGQWWG
jgi:hypothetical protein